MNLLAFDLLPRSVEIYLKYNENEIYKCVKTEEKPSELLLEVIDSFLKENRIPLGQLDFITCNKGPGSFTALRIAMSTGKGLAEGAGIPMVSVCGLDCCNTFSENTTDILLPVIDGRKKRFYAAFYAHGHRLGNYMDLSAEEIVKAAPAGRTIAVCGEDAETFREALGGTLPLSWKTADPFPVPPIVEWSRIAAKKYADGLTDSPAEGPFYIRKSQAEEGNG